MAIAMMSIAILGFLVWGHHMFVSGQSMYAGIVFSIISFMIGIPTAIKVFNWTTTLYKGSISADTPMLYALGYIGLFVVGGLTGLVLATPGGRRPPPRHLLRRGPLPLHHGGWDGDGLPRRHPLLVAQDHRAGCIPNSGASSRRLLVFVGFNLTFFPQFVLGYLGMPRRYHEYPAEFQVLQRAVVGRGVDPRGRLRPAADLSPALAQVWAIAGPNPWGATGLEWQTPSPPTTHNFEETPIVTEDPYEYEIQEGPSV